MYIYQFATFSANDSKTLSSLLKSDIVQLLLIPDFSKTSCIYIIAFELSEPAITVA
jgi:hypothetical protein